MIPLELILRTSKPVNKNLKVNLWSSIDEADVLIYMIDILRFNYKNIIQDIKNYSVKNLYYFF